MNTNRSGKIEGKVSGELATDTETYVFLYKRGEYSFLTETMSWGTSGILFANAVTSAKVNADGRVIAFHLLRRENMKFI